MTDWHPMDLPFTATPGPRGAAAELQSDQPVDFLELFLTDELLELICRETNRYADVQRRSADKPHSRIHRWQEVTVIEMKRFLGLVFLTSLVQKPDVILYWAGEEPTATPYFSRIMNRDRFQNIWRNLHFTNNETLDKNDDFCKVRQVLDYLLSKFKELYMPGQDICISEGTFLWRGTQGPQENQVGIKSNRVGIKSYMLACSKTGFCLSMKPCSGRSVVASSRRDVPSMREVVVFLLEAFTGFGYRLWLDNYYSSVRLCKFLLGLQTHTCGTLQRHRGEPRAITELTTTKLEEGEAVMRHDDGVMVVAWHDKKVVRMVTTFHQHDMVQTVKNQRGQKEKVKKTKPTCVAEYNHCVNGVSKLDHSLASYFFVRKTYKWSKKFVMNLMLISMFNAFVLYKTKNPTSRKTLYQFILSVVTSWTSQRVKMEPMSEEGDHYQEEPPFPGSRAPSRDPPSRLDGNVEAHVLYRIPSTGKKRIPQKRCRVHAKQGLRKDTRFQCNSCNVPLCRGICEMLYHNKLNYEDYSLD